MNEEQNFEEVSPADVPAKVAELRSQGYRMVQICGVTETGATELIYSFDKDHRMVNLKVQVPHGTSVKSITPTYWAAFVYENEIHDLFGVEFTESQLDYKGNYFRMSVKTPWRGPDSDEKESEEKEGQRWEREL